MDKIVKINSARIIVLGIDVDSHSSAVAALDISTGVLEREARLTHDEAVWRKFLALFPDCRVWAVYEAGATGFGLCRMLRSLGVECEVVAPSTVPKSPVSRQTKTDRRDALMLTQLFVNRPRHFVRVPTETEEAARELIRSRYQLQKDKTRVMCRIKMKLLFFGIRPPVECIAWSKRYRNWLRETAVSVPVRIALDAQYVELTAIEAQIKILDNALSDLSKTSAYHDRVQRLLQLRGVGRLTAMAFLLEVFHPEEFVTADQLACHLGFTASEYSSADSVRRGHITHWGPPLLRKMLVEAAWIWIYRDPQARERYYSIKAGKQRKQAIVAMARRPAIIMWAMTVKEQEYAYRWAA